MNEELQERMFNWIAAASEKIGDFAVQEVPPFIHEYLTWKFLEAAVGAVSWGGICLLGPVWLIFFSKKVWGWAEKEDTDGFCYVVAIVSFMASVLISLFTFPISEIKDMIQIKVAPKVYLLERAAEFVKK